MKDKWTSIAAIAGIVILELMAIMSGIDGVMLSLAIGAMAAIAGVSLDRLLRKE